MWVLQTCVSILLFLSSEDSKWTSFHPDGAPWLWGLLFNFVCKGYFLLSVVPVLLTFESSKLKYSERNDNLVSYEANVLDWYFKKKGSSHLNNVSELHQIRCICTFCSITFLFLLLHSSLLFERFLSWISVPLIVWEYILKVLVDLGNKVLGFSSEMWSINIWCLFFFHQI